MKDSGKNSKDSSKSRQRKDFRPEDFLRTGQNPAQKRACNRIRIWYNGDGPANPGAKRLNDSLQRFDSLLRKLGIRQTGRPCKTRDRPRYKTAGESTAIGVSAYWELLFQANELLPTSRKLTDADILIAVQTEFPRHRPAQQAELRMVGLKRSRYNCGRLTGLPKGRPPIKSVPYNSDGEPLRPKGF